MKKIYALIIISFFLTSLTSAQQEIDPLNILKTQFESFQYAEVIQSADSLLKNNTGLSNKQLIEIYRVKGISEYSLLEEANAGKSFNSILNIDSTFQLDSATTSPKIIDFFNNIKAKFSREKAVQRELQAKPDTVNNPAYKPDRLQAENLRNAMIRSLILPGLGHLYLGEKTRGILLTSASAISMGAMIYFIIDANKKQSDYQGETNPALIPARYNDYNNSYKFRNASIIMFAALWLYSQADILFFTDFNSGSELHTRLLPRLNYDYQRGLLLSYDLSF